MVARVQDGSGSSRGDAVADRLADRFERPNAGPGRVEADPRVGKWMPATNLPATIAILAAL